MLLVAFCSPSGSYGVPFSVVLDASWIIANNSDGTLRLLGGDADLIPPIEHSLLPPGHYEYRVTGGEAYVDRLSSAVSDLFDVAVDPFVHPFAPGDHPTACLHIGMSL